MGGNGRGLTVLEAFPGGGKCNSNGRELISKMEASVEGVEQPISLNEERVANMGLTDTPSICFPSSLLE